MSMNATPSGDRIHIGFFGRRNAGHRVRLSVNRKDGRVRLNGNAHFARPVNVALGVFGAGQLLAKAVQTKAIVDALAQDAARLMLALQDEQIVNPVFFGRDGRREAGRARTDDEQIHLFYQFVHLSTPPS